MWILIISSKNCSIITHVSKKIGESIDSVLKISRKQMPSSKDHIHWTHLPEFILEQRHSNAHLMSAIASKHICTSQFLLLLMMIVCWLLSANNFTAELSFISSLRRLFQVLSKHPAGSTKNSAICEVSKFWPNVSQSECCFSFLLSTNIKVFWNLNLLYLVYLGYKMNWL